LAAFNAKCAKNQPAKHHKRGIFLKLYHYLSDTNYTRRQAGELTGTFSSVQMLKVLRTKRERKIKVLLFIQAPGRAVLKAMATHVIRMMSREMNKLILYLLLAG